MRPQTVLHAASLTDPGLPSLLSWQRGKAFAYMRTRTKRRSYMRQPAYPVLQHCDTAGGSLRDCLFSECSEHSCTHHLLQPAPLPVQLHAKVCPGFALAALDDLDDLIYKPLIRENPHVASILE